jgi:hypothetical protein
VDPAAIPDQHWNILLPALIGIGLVPALAGIWRFMVSKSRAAGIVSFVISAALIVAATQARPLAGKVWEATGGFTPSGLVTMLSPLAAFAGLWFFLWALDNDRR